MMEGMNQMGQEEYIWAMRTSLYHETDDSEAWKLRRSTESQLLYGKKSKSMVDTTGDAHQTKVMASLVPDEVITNVDDYNHRKYDACFLFGDVSGFTELCEKYTKLGVSGPSRMTAVLNKYLGAMVQEVLSHNGDVLKFSGDAFLAMFKTTKNQTMRDAVHEGLDTALVIQKSYGSYLTDVNVVIRVKLAISAGLVTFALIGTPTTSHYVVVGKPIWDVKAGESISSAGDIIVAPAAWHYVNPSEYLYQDMSDKIHIKLLGVGPSWRSVQRNLRQQKQRDDDESSDSSSSEDDEVTEGTTADEFSLRPAVNQAVRLRIKEPLRRFIIMPVMKSIDMNEPFEYLTEMRQVVIVFINVVSSSLEMEKTVILTDQTYKIVCRVVHKMKGCVNKVSLFDKDLMFVVIFGLRGLKHELECQVALRCARECHETISKLPGVVSTSIGVTTGKTYCGVFGHTLRREYTVISLIVNKAARLMVAYKGKVSCDRETFLRSKLESKHFILQEYKYLKGISQPGPVYEFREKELEPDQILKLNPRPLLGKHEKLKLYRRLLDKNIQPSIREGRQEKMLMINGDARKGKTRLLDELVHITPQEIPVNRITLMAKDKKVPYYTMRLIFDSPLSLTRKSSVKEREQMLLDKLRKIQVPDLLCVLNNVLGVKFRNSDRYLALSEKQRFSALQKMIKQLCYNCFLTLWVIALDNCQYMDDESWEIFDTLLDVKNIFIVATQGRDMHESPRSKKILEDRRVKMVELKEIERCYLGALACQIMDVYAISAELENAIQTRSNGNPGWVESFLISVYQDGGIFIVKASMREIHEMGLVCPPLYMMARLTREERIRWQHIMEERRYSMDSMVDQTDEWNLYIDSCRDSYLNVTVREQMETLSRGEKLPICIISPKFHLGDEETEDSLDVLLLKTFDSLNFYEQLLVKCSAILGNQFLRDMLLYVMSAKDKRKAAQAVQKLFEIKVLTCANGDFLEGGISVFKEKLMNPNEQRELRCTCRGIRIEENCEDLPRYASCGYMQFRSSLFRDITYNLLTDNQKKEFHQRAIRYLERETRKCKACGNGFFESLLGARHDKDFLRVKERVKNMAPEGESWDTASRRTSIHSTSTTASGSSSRRLTDTKSSVSIPSQIFIDSKSEKVYRSKLGFRIINRLKNSFSLTRAFSAEDFTDCQCHLILSTTYAQLIDHCAGAQELSKLVDAMLEYSHISIVQCNIPLALKILDEALDVLSQREKEKSANTWQLSMTRGKIYTVKGFARIELGQFKVAFKDLHQSLKEHGIRFPRGFGMRLKICKQEFTQMFGYYVLPRTLMKRLDHWENIFANNLAECLSHLCTLYMIRDQWTSAEMAASWSLIKAFEAFSHFQMICTTCANMLHVAQHYRKWNMCIAIEVHSLRLCHLKRTSVDAEDLKCVATLYGVIFCSRLLRSDMEKAIHIGYIVLRLCFSIRAVKIILPLLPLLLYALLVGKHFNNAFSILQELEYFSAEDADSSGKVWYLALCIGIQLETGYCAMSYQTCEKFYQSEGDRWITIRDPDARKRFFTVMWLWCVRNEKWEEAAIWCLKTDDFSVVSEHDSLANKVTALYLLEGMILFMVSKLDKRNIKAVVRAENEIKAMFKALDKAAKTTKMILPRLYHMKAYYKYVKGNDSKVTELMDKATKYAKQYGHPLEESWIEHSTKAWERTLPAINIDFWREHSEPDNLLNFQDIEVEADKPGLFTLPTPIYI